MRESVYYLLFYIHVAFILLFIVCFLDLSEFNVKIFVGVEYECPRGHRFMCSAPDKVLKTSGTGLVKDNGNKVTGCDMPLYFPCPCM